MPLYRYEAADRLGKKTKEVIEAQDEQAVVARLKELGLMPLSIKPATERASAGFGLGAFAGRITQKDLLTFTQEMGSLLEAGLPIDRAIYVLSAHSEKAAMREILEEVYKDVQRGRALSQALGRHKVFPPLYVNMIRAGEVGGILEGVVARLATFIETSVAFQEELSTALAYPILLSTVGGLAVSFIMLFVVPRFAVMFKDMGQAVPAPTQILMDISTFVTGYWWLILAVLVAVAYMLRTYLATEEGQRQMDNLKLKVPVISSLHMKTVIARFARTLGTLLQSGVPILEAITVSRQVVGNVIISERLGALEEGVRRGRGVSAPLKECGVFPSIVTQMVAVGEEAGKLDQTFITIAHRFEGEASSMVKRVMGMLGPLLILVMALVVGFIVVSMLLAVFSINEISL